MLAVVIRHPNWPVRVLATVEKPRLPDGEIGHAAAGLKSILAVVMNDRPLKGIIGTGKLDPWIIGIPQPIVLICQSVVVDFDISDQIIARARTHRYACFVIPIDRDPTPFRAVDDQPRMIADIDTTRSNVIGFVYICRLVAIWERGRATAKNHRPAVPARLFGQFDS